MFILNFIPDWFFPAVAGLCVILFFVTRFFPVLPYNRVVHYATIPIFSLCLFLTGANWNNNIWQSKLAEETAKVELAAKKQEEVNQQLHEEREAKLAQIKESRQREREMNNKFIATLKAKDATVQNVINSLSQAEQDKYKALDAKQKAEADKKLQDVLDNAKSCPTVPELYVEKHNDSAKKGVKTK